ncbi:MAG TPA: flagellar hook-basal body protein [Tissierellia bacterium]|jgi:flagellar basal-body rod protein FlgF|nr:flagellar hook-basal body protein [Tissierellia bacterium]
MSRGFYALTSGMLTQQRKIDVQSNNIANLNTAGYKKEEALTSNFGNLFIHKYKEKGIYREETPINNVSAIRTVTETNTHHSQGALEETGLITDFAIAGSGFFAVENNGEILYTRNGSFTVDEEGYLLLPGIGRVQGEFGDLYVGGDKFEVTPGGSIVVEGEIVDNIAVYDFVDYNLLNKFGPGLFISNEEPELVDYPTVLNGTLERSNVDLTEELTNMLAAQRALQTAAQALKIYDMVNDKAVNEIGKI